MCISRCRTCGTGRGACEPHDNRLSCDYRRPPRRRFGRHQPTSMGGQWMTDRKQTTATNKAKRRSVVMQNKDPEAFREPVSPLTNWEPPTVYKPLKFRRGDAMFISPPSKARLMAGR